MELRAFLEFVYLFDRASGVPADAHLTVWSKQTKDSAHFPVAEGFDNPIKAAETIVSRQHDAYFAVGLRQPGLTHQARGRKSDVIAIPGLWLDLDLKSPPGIHNATNLPADISAGLDLAQKACQHDPTVIVDSGYGLHVYWLFNKLLVIPPEMASRYNAASKLFQKPFIEAAARDGLLVDSTGNIDRVLRLPDTLNFKKRSDGVEDAPKRVEVLIYDGPRYDPAVLFGAAPAKTSSASAPSPDLIMPADILLAKVKTRIDGLKNLENKTFMARIRRGLPFTPGARDTELQKAASIIAFCCFEEANPDPETLVALLEPTLEATQAAGDDPENPAPTREDAVDKLFRALQDQEENRLQGERIMSALKKKAVVSSAAEKSTSSPGVDGSVGGPTSNVTETPGEAREVIYARETSTGTTLEYEVELVKTPPPVDPEVVVPYTEEDLERFAASQKTTPIGFLRRWIIQQGTAYYVFVGGRYRYPVTSEALATKLRDDLAPADKLGVSLWTIKTDGEVRRKNEKELMDAYGTAAREIRGSFILPGSYYNKETDTFWEAIAVPRPIAPLFDPQIDEWLRLLGGDQYDNLARWIASVTLLNYQNSALYLSGKPASGKSMLAQGLSRIWTDTGLPTPLDDVISSSFNSDIAKCPFIFADEAMTASTKELRRLVGSSSHMLRRKYMPNVAIEGSVRVMLADNSRELLNKNEDLNSDDMEAVATKFLQIDVGPDPTEYLKSLGGRAGTKDWVDGDRIAAHAMWLKETTPLTIDGRFIVEGHATRMHQVLATQGKIPQLVLEWLAGYLDKPLINIKQQGTAVVGGGHILINVDAIVNHWTLYIQSERMPPSRTRVGKALANMASNKVRRIGTRRYHDVNPEAVFVWAEDQGAGDIEAIRARVAAPLPAETLAIMGAAHDEEVEEVE